MALSTPPPLLATIQDYDPTTDTCSISLDHIGLITPWIDGVPIAQGVSRAALAAGIRCLVQLLDPHSYCTAQVVGVYYGGSTSNYGGSAPNGGLQGSVTGRAGIQTNGSGLGSVSPSFGHTFATAPYVQAVADNGASLTITAVTVSNFTCQLATAGPVNAWVYLSWAASGNF